MKNSRLRTGTFTAVFVLLSVITVGVTTTQAQTVYIYDFLRNDASARASAMGGAFMTVTNDPSAMYYNPATLFTIDTTQLSLTFFKHVLDINSGFATYATKVEGVGNIGVGVNYNSYGTFDRTDRSGNIIGDFGSSDIAFTLGWANELGEGFSAGINANAIFSSIDEYGSNALALDGGLLYQDTARRVQAGLSLLHLGSQLSSFGEETEELPLDLKLGVSHQLRGLPLLVALNVSRLLDDREKFLDRFSSFSVGGEFTISKPLRLRFGYNNRVRQDVAFGQSKGLAGISGGLGILVKDYRIDYAFNSLATLGGLHRFSVNTTF